MNGMELEPMKIEEILAPLELVQVVKWATECMEGPNVVDEP